MWKSSPETETHHKHCDGCNKKNIAIRTVTHLERDTKDQLENGHFITDSRTILSGKEIEIEGVAFLLCTSCHNPQALHRLMQRIESAKKTRRQLEQKLARIESGKAAFEKEEEGIRKRLDSLIV